MIAEKQNFVFFLPRKAECHDTCRQSNDLRIHNSFIFARPAV